MVRPAGRHAEVDLDSALAGIEASTPRTAPAPAGPAASAGTASAPATTAARPTAGRWTVDTSTTNAEGTGSFAGFRIDEVLATIVPALLQEGLTGAVGDPPA